MLSSCVVAASKRQDSTVAAASAGQLAMPRAELPLLPVESAAASSHQAARAATAAAPVPSTVFLLPRQMGRRPSRDPTADAAVSPKPGGGGVKQHDRSGESGVEQAQ